jgi:hypothetical protein
MAATTTFVGFSKIARGACGQVPDGLYYILLTNGANLYIGRSLNKMGLLTATATILDATEQKFIVQGRFYYTKSLGQGTCTITQLDVEAINGIGYDPTIKIDHRKRI